VDKGKYSHVAIAVSDTKIFEAQYNTRTHIVRNPYTDYDIVRLPLTRYEREQVVTKCYNLRGHWYDYLQAISYLIKYFSRGFKIINNPKYFICSEVVDIVVSDLNLEGYNGSKGNIEPNELIDKLLSIPGSRLL
jgi:hypothetical protein